MGSVSSSASCYSASAVSQKAAHKVDKVKDKNKRKIWKNDGIKLFREESTKKQSENPCKVRVEVLKDKVSTKSTTPFKPNQDDVQRLSHSWSDKFTFNTSSGTTLISRIDQLSNFVSWEVFVTGVGIGIIIDCKKPFEYIVQFQDGRVLVVLDELSNTVQKTHEKHCTLNTFEIIFLQKLI